MTKARILLEEIVDELVDSLEYHDQLNPALWSGEILKPEIKEHLLSIAKVFLEDLDLSDLDVKDFWLTGSNANFNWSEFSDVDLHLISDFSAYNPRERSLVDELLEAKQSLWSRKHKIEIYGYPVEIYVQDIDNELSASGIYSLKADKWIKKPQHIQLQDDDAAVEAKVKSLTRQAEDLISDRNTTVAQIEKFRDKIHQMRQAGLDENGEFSVENMTFKVLRNKGLLDDLKQKKLSIEDYNLSLGQD